MVNDENMPNILENVKTTFEILVQISGIGAVMAFASLFRRASKYSSGTAAVIW